MAELAYTSVDNLEWFQNGPTTHLTEDGEVSLCGVEKPHNTETHPTKGGEYVCNRCAQIAED